MTLFGHLGRFAGQPQAEAVLFGISALEGALLPVPAEDLLAPMVLLEEDKAFRYAAIAMVGSVFGALAAFEVAFALFQAVWAFVGHIVALQLPLAILQVVIVDYAPLIVLAAGISAVPYKVVTFLAGFLGAGLLGFVLASVVSRAARFFLISWYLWRGGRDYLVWLDRYFYGLSTVISLGLLLVLTLGVFIFKTS